MTDASGSAITSTASFANINPIRYRGYYYDSETGFYYLKSRYYDPQNCRFVSADTRIDLNCGSTNLNLFAYCGNDPVNNIDPHGESFLATIIVCVVIGAVAGGTIGGVASYNAAKSDGLSGADLFWETVEGAGKGALIGGTIGGLVGTNIGVIATYGASSTFGTATISGTATIGAKFTEVTALQWKSSSARGQDAWHTVDECVDSVFGNGHKILTPVALKPLTTYGAYSWKDITKYKVVGLRFDDYLSSPGGKILPSIFVTWAWNHTRKSIFSDDPLSRAKERSYTIK